DRKKAAEVLIRCDSRHEALLPQLSMLLVQKLTPLASGWRFRKSRYCCVTKNRLSSSALVVGTVVLLSTIVSTERPGLLSPDPTGLLKTRFTVSFPSGSGLFSINTLKFLLVWPAAKDNLPAVAMYLLV